MKKPFFFTNLRSYHDRLKGWKPIHLCWWFKKHNLPIPPYFIGGGADHDLCGTGPRYGADGANMSAVAAGAEAAANVINWVAGDVIIVMFKVTDAAHTPPSETMELWVDKDGGGALSLADSELAGIDPDAFNDNDAVGDAVDVVAGCAPGGSYENGMASIDGDVTHAMSAQNNFTEMWFAVDTTNATNGSIYTFSLWSFVFCFWSLV